MLIKKWMTGSSITGENLIPARTEAEKLLKEAGIYNPGPWGNHSRAAAHCVEKPQKCICDLVEKESCGL